jgi:hypothetical protein
MACCAAAAFFISQIALAFESVRRRLFGARVRETARNDAVAWSLGAPAVVPTRRPRRTRRLIAGALVAEALLIAGSATAWTNYNSTPSPVMTEQSLWSLAMDSICTSGSAEQSRQWLTNWIEGKRP